MVYDQTSQKQKNMNILYLGSLCGQKTCLKIDIALNVFTVLTNGSFDMLEMAK